MPNRIAALAIECPSCREPYSDMKGYEHVEKHGRCRACDELDEQIQENRDVSIHSFLSGLFQPITYSRMFAVDKVVGFNPQGALVVINMYDQKPWVWDYANNKFIPWHA